MESKVAAIFEGKKYCTKKDMLDDVQAMDISFSKISKNVSVLKMLPDFERKIVHSATRYVQRSFGGHKKDALHCLRLAYMKFDHPDVGKPLTKMVPNMHELIREIIYQYGSPSNRIFVKWDKLLAAIPDFSSLLHQGKVSPAMWAAIVDCAESGYQPVRHIIGILAMPCFDLQFRFFYVIHSDHPGMFRSLRFTLPGICFDLAIDLETVLLGLPRNANTTAMAASHNGYETDKAAYDIVDKIQAQEKHSLKRAGALVPMIKPLPNYNFEKAVYRFSFIPSAPPRPRAPVCPAQNAQDFAADCLKEHEKKSQEATKAMKLLDILSSPPKVDLEFNKKFHVPLGVFPDLVPEYLGMYLLLMHHLYDFTTSKYVDYHILLEVAARGKYSLEEFIQPSRCLRKTCGLVLHSRIRGIIYLGNKLRSDITPDDFTLLVDTRLGPTAATDIAVKEGSYTIFHDALTKLMCYIFTAKESPVPAKIVQVIFPPPVPNETLSHRASMSSSRSAYTAYTNGVPIVEALKLLKPSLPFMTASPNTTVRQAAYITENPGTRLPQVIVDLVPQSHWQRAPHNSPLNVECDENVPASPDQEQLERDENVPASPDRQNPEQPAEPLSRAAPSQNRKAAYQPEVFREAAESPRRAAPPPEVVREESEPPRRAAPPQEVVREEALPTRRAAPQPEVIKKEPVARYRSKRKRTKPRRFSPSSSDDAHDNDARRRVTRSWSRKHPK